MSEATTGTPAAIASRSVTPKLAMRVGALPQFPANALNYNLTWSTDGLINEYCNLCEAIHDGRRIQVLPLEGLEAFSLDGVRYEAFNTSGGLGTLCESLENRVRESGHPGVRVGNEAEASMMFGGTGSAAGEPIPPWIRDMIRRKVRGYLPELEAAYSVALRRNPGLRGKLLIRFRIDATGKIQQAEAMEASFRDASFTADIMEKVGHWSFEPTEGRTVEVLYPLVFFVPT